MTRIDAQNKFIATVDQDANKHLITCTICGNIYRGKGKYTNIRKHLENAHNKEVDGAEMADNTFAITPEDIVAATLETSRNADEEIQAAYTPTYPDARRFDAWSER